MNDVEATGFGPSLAAACQGDREALAGVLNALRPELVRQVRLRLDADLLRRLDPEDVVQQATLEALRRFPEWCAARSYPFRVWARLITRQCLDEARRRHLGAGKRDARREVAGLAGAGPDSATLADWMAASQTTPSEAARRAELVARLRLAVEGLPAGDREILTLRQFEGLSNEEAALELGIQPAAASKRFVRCLARLRPLLESFLPESGGAA